MADNQSIELLEDAVLGKTSELFHLSTVAEYKHAALNLASQATRSICIFSYDLEPQIYDQTQFLDAVKDLAIRSPLSSIRILLQDNARAQREGHKLIQLWRRLTSKIEIRRPSPDYIEHYENFLIVDDIGYLHRKLYSRYEATAAFDSRLEARRLSSFFNGVWEQSEPDSELRALQI
jgi:hypothetical protein